MEKLLIMEGGLVDMLMVGELVRWKMGDRRWGSVAAMWRRRYEWLWMMEKRVQPWRCYGNGLPLASFSQPVEMVCGDGNVAAVL